MARVNFKITKCSCGELHILAHDVEPCAACRVAARKFYVPPKEVEPVPDDVPEKLNDKPLSNEASA